MGSWANAPKHLRQPGHLTRYLSMYYCINTYVEDIEAVRAETQWFPSQGEAIVSETPLKLTPNNYSVQFLATLRRATTSVASAAPSSSKTRHLGQCCAARWRPSGGDSGEHGVKKNSKSILGASPQQDDGRNIKRACWGTRQDRTALHLLMACQPATGLRRH